MRYTKSKVCVFCFFSNLPSLYQGKKYKKIKTFPDDYKFEAQQFREYFNQQLSSKLSIKPAADPSEQNGDAPEIAIEKPNFITIESLESIKAFIEERIISEYTVYRAALFQNNPSNLQYQKFKTNMEIGDIVKFDNDQYLLQIKEFRDNYVLLQPLDKEDDIEFIVSKDQTKFLSLVRKAQSQSDIDAVKKLKLRLYSQPRSVFVAWDGSCN